MFIKMEVLLQGLNAVSENRAKMEIILHETTEKALQEACSLKNWWNKGVEGGKENLPARRRERAKKGR